MTAPTRFPFDQVPGLPAQQNFDAIRKLLDAAYARLLALETTGTTPTGAAGGDLTGTFPSPTIAAGAVTNAKVSASAAIAYSKLALTGSVTNADLAGSIAYAKLVLTGAILNADLAGSIAYSKLVLTNSVVNADVAAAAAIAYSKLNLAGSVTNADLAGSIALSKLATDPLARANHTGTQLASTISNFDTQVRTSSLNQMTAPTADLSINSHKLTNVTDPSAAQDATTLAYVQGKIFPQRGLVDYATAAALASYTGGGTSTITASANGALSVDGGSPSAGQRVLVKDEGVGGVAHLQNGIYTVTNAGSAGTKWVLTRATDLDAADEFAAGVVAKVQRGNANGDTTWVMKTDPPITVNTTAIVFRRDGNNDATNKVVRVASTANITLSNPGTSTFDGVSLSAGDRILVKNQSTASQNGIYVFNGSGVAMTRAPDFDAASEIVPGTFVYVTEGALANAAQLYQLKISTYPITVGTTSLTFNSQVISSQISLTSGSSLGDITFNGTRFDLGGEITGNVGTPVDPTDAATKSYADTQDSSYDTSIRGYVDTNKSRTTYTPTWTSSGSAPAIGNGTLTGSYIRFGTMVYFTINLTWGSTTTAGTGFYSLSLPVAVGSTFRWVVVCDVTDSGVQQYQGWAVLTAAATTVTPIWSSTTQTGTVISGTSPITFGTNDQINVSGLYGV